MNKLNEVHANAQYQKNLEITKKWILGIVLVGAICYVSKTVLDIYSNIEPLPCFPEQAPVVELPASEFEKISRIFQFFLNNPYAAASLLGYFAFRG